MSLAALKKSRKKNIENMINATKTEESGQGNADSRFWQPTVDEAGNGYAVIRFLPTPNAADGDIPWRRYFSHGFKGPTGLWYIEKSLTSIGQKDPVAEINSEMWNKNDDENCPLKKIVRQRKRRMHYVSNILVVKDEKHPENEGKVFLFRYGKKIHDKLRGVMEPEFEDEQKIDPFDLWDGADFRLKIMKKDGYRNYDRSDFGSPKPISEDDDEMEEIYSKTMLLDEFVDPETYKSYDELKKELARVLGEASEKLSTEQEVELSKSEEPSSFSEQSEEDAGPAEELSDSEPEEEEDDSVSYFAKLAAETDD